MKLKNIISRLSFAAALFLPLAATAGDLNITNNTNHDSTTSTRGVCSSTLLGADGVTKAHSTHTVKEKNLKIACFLMEDSCKADVYMTNNCTGPVVANVEFSVNSGIKQVDILDQTYTMTFDPSKPFTAQIDGGPAVTN